MRAWIFVSKTAVKKLLHYGEHHARDGYERIGVLLGCGGFISEVIEATLDSGRGHAVLDEHKLLELFSAMPDGLRIIGWWHTHWENPYPSPVDVETQRCWQAIYEGAVAAIVSAARRVVVFWRLEGGKPLIVREIREVEQG